MLLLTSFDVCLYTVKMNITFTRDRLWGPLPRRSQSKMSYFAHFEHQSEAEATATHEEIPPDLYDL